MGRESNLSLLSDKKEGKLPVCTTLKQTEIVEVRLQSFLTWALDGGECTYTHLPAFALEKTSAT